MCLHRRDAGLVDIAPMLDGVYARLRRPQDRLRPMRMRGPLASPPVRVRTDRDHLFLRILRRLRVIPLGQHPTRRPDLDQVRAVLDVLPDHVLYRRDPVRHTLAHHMVLVRQQVLVHMPARNSQSRPRHLHMWPRHVARVDLVPQRHIRKVVRAHVPHCGEARLQRCLRVLHPEDRLLARRHRQLEVGIEVRRPRQVHMHIDEPRQHRLPAEIHLTVATPGRRRCRRRHAHNFLALHNHRRVRRLPAGPHIQNSPRPDQRPPARRRQVRRLRRCLCLGSTHHQQPTCQSQQASRQHHKAAVRRTQSHASVLKQGKVGK